MEDTLLAEMCERQFALDEAIRENRRPWEKVLAAERGEIPADWTILWRE